MKSIFYILIAIFIFSIISPAFTNKSKVNIPSAPVINDSSIKFIDSNTNSGIQELSIQEKTFEYLWKQFDNNYSLFKVKNIDWQDIYKVYRPQVTDTTNDDELFNIMSEMLKHFNDNHVGLYGGENPFRMFWSDPKMNEELGGFGKEGHKKFKANVEKSKTRAVPECYFVEDISKSENENFEYSWLTDSIGYFYFKSFRGQEEVNNAMDSIILKFQNAKAIIIDKRQCGGGSDVIGQTIINRFADKKRLYARSQDRNGHCHADFEPVKLWYMEPDSLFRFNKRVIVLTDHTTGSASEVFAMGMRTMPHVTIIGDTTSGCFGDAYAEFLPNRWQFMCTYGLVTDRNGVCWEGIGVVPDIYKINTLEDKQTGRDKVLESAIDLINSNSLKPKKDKDYIEDTYISLLKVLKKEYRNNGLNRAKKVFYKTKTKNPGTYYLNWDELMNFASYLETEGKVDDAIKVLKLGIAEFPETIYLYEKVARICNDAGKMEKAKTCYKNLIDINRLSYPWEKKWNEEAMKVFNDEILPKEECGKSCCSQ